MKISDLLLSSHNEDLLLALSLLRQTDFLEFVTNNKLIDSYTLFLLGYLFYADLTKLKIERPVLGMRPIQLDEMFIIWNTTLKHIVVTYECQ